MLIVAVDHKRRVDAPQIMFLRDGLGQVFRVFVDGDYIQSIPIVLERKAFDNTFSGSRRDASAIPVRTCKKACGLYDQRITFPIGDRVTQ